LNRIREEARDELPVLGRVPQFQFVNERGQPFGTADLRGKAWVANFVFTRCPSICPLITQKMAWLQRQTAGVGEAIHLVSFTVDPEYDSPEVLREYARKHGADPARWTFLTGDPKRMRQTIVDGFKVGVGGSSTRQDVANLFHSTRFVLVDPTGGIRGYYRSEEAESMDQLVSQLNQLAKSR
jgi:protein SCO1/2